MSWWGRSKPIPVPTGTSTIQGKTVDVTIPSGQTIDLQGLETWQVTWLTRRSSGGRDPDFTRTKPKGQLFTNMEDAKAFAEALVNAYNLVGNTIDTEYVTYERVMQ